MNFSTRGKEKRQKAAPPVKGGGKRSEAALAAPRLHLTPPMMTALFMGASAL